MFVQGLTKDGLADKEGVSTPRVLITAYFMQMFMGETGFRARFGGT